MPCYQLTMNYEGHILIFPIKDVDRLVNLFYFDNRLKNVGKQERKELGNVVLATEAMASFRLRLQLQNKQINTHKPVV